MERTGLHRMNAEIAGLLEQKLGAGGDGLAAKLRQAGYRLPRPVRRAGRQLVAASQKSANPRLMKQIDQEALRRAHRRCLTYLRRIDPARRRARLRAEALLDLGTKVAISAALLIAFLMWRGFL